MTQSAFEASDTHVSGQFWRAPVRALYWLLALSLASATILTTQGDLWHTAWGWVALGALGARLAWFRGDGASGPVMWLIAGMVAVMDLSGWLAPYGILHTGATLVALVVAALASATVIFESLQCATTPASA